MGKATSGAATDANSDEPESGTRLQVNEALDAEIDMGPFDRVYAPFLLASLVDPKNLPGLTELGGAQGVLRAQGTNPRRAASGSAVAREKEKRGSGFSLGRVLSREK
jgi:hypothetical protein